MDINPQTAELPFAFTQHYTAEQAAIVEQYAIERGWPYELKIPEVKRMREDVNEMVFTIRYSYPQFGEGLDAILFRVIDDAFNPVVELHHAKHLGNYFYVIENHGGIFAAMDHFCSQNEDRFVKRMEEGDFTVAKFPALVHLYVGENDYLFADDVPVEALLAHFTG